MSPALVWFLQTALIIGAIVATIYLIRRHKPDGLAAVIVAPVNIVTASATRFADWLRAGTNRLRQHADEHGQRVFSGAAHPLATGLMYVGLAGLWLTVMTFYVLRNATIVLTEHREFMRASRLLDPSFIDPKPLAPLMALAEVFAPVMLTAVAGIIVLELLGFTDHIPFLHRDRRSQKLLLGTFALAVLVVAMVMQLSVARQDMANAWNETQATIRKEEAAQVAPLPFDATPAETQVHADRLNEFNETVRTPLEVAYYSTVGPTGWRTWLPIGAALVDFVFAFALVPALIMLWLLFVRVLRAPLELLRAAVNAVAYVARLTGGVVLRTLGLRDPGAPTDPTGAVAPAPAPTPTGGPGAALAAAPPATPVPVPVPPAATAAAPTQQVSRPSWAGGGAGTPNSGTETNHAPPVSSIDRFNPFASSATR